jgi:hypothetical protein
MSEIEYELRDLPLSEINVKSPGVTNADALHLFGGHALPLASTERVNHWGEPSEGGVASPCAAIGRTAATIGRTAAEAV